MRIFLGLLLLIGCTGYTVSGQQDAQNQVDQWSQGYSEGWNDSRGFYVCDAGWGFDDAGQWSVLPVSK